MEQIGTFATPHASRYLQQLCKHFAHKVEVAYSPGEGTAMLPPGPAKMRATADNLRIEITGPDTEALERARFIIDSHLVRFAHREAFEQMDWADASAQNKRLFATR